MRSCVIYYFLDVDQIMEGVLRMYSNIIVVVYSEMIVLDIVNLVGKFRGKVDGDI